MWEVKTHQLQLQNIDKDHTRSGLLHSASSLWVAGRAGKAHWRGWKDQSQSLWIAGHSERGWKESFVCENPSAADNRLTKTLLDLDSATASALWVTGRAGKARWRGWKYLQKKETMMLDLAESLFLICPFLSGTSEIWNGGSGGGSMIWRGCNWGKVLDVKIPYWGSVISCRQCVKKNQHAMFKWTSSQAWYGLGLTDWHGVCARNCYLI